ncbi:hypothetical protein V5O48_016876 [Marasmius crinis-equi]|uniref:Cytochrome P450 n=1 Tax=Marasmius crinis-equi TaxID=585013 RepID=A0ABR3EQR9_9AGAR
MARQIESGGAHEVFKKPLGSMRALRLWGPNLAASNGEQWRKHRRVMGPAFNQKLYTVVWKKTREIYRVLVDTPEWKNSKEDGVTFEPVQGMTYKLALIILGSCGFGLPGSWTEPPRTQTDDPKAMTVQYALRTVADSSGLIIFAPEWVKRLPFHRIQEPQQALVQLSGFMQEQIRIRKSEEKEEEEREEEGGVGVGKNNVLTLLVQASEDEEGKYQLEDEELIGNVFLLLLAGHETTANALAGTFGFLAAHPEIQKEVYDHIVDVVGMDRDPTFEDYIRLNKVAAAFLEAVRFFPGGHVLIREAGEDTIVDIPADPKTGKEKESIPVAKGVNVIVDMIGIRASFSPLLRYLRKLIARWDGIDHNPRYFDEPDEYRPSRWYNVSSDSDVFTGFSVGPRACIGRKFATVEAVCWLTMILRDFEVRPAGLREGETVADWERRILVPNFTLTLGVGDVPGSMRALRLWGPNLAASNGEQWRKHRRVMGPAFNQKLYTVVWKKTREIYREMVDTPEWKNSKEDGVTFEPVQGMTYKLALIILGSCGFGLPGSWFDRTPRTQTDDPKAMTVQYALRTVADSSGLIVFAPEWVKRLPFHRIQEPQQALVQLSGFMQEQIRIRKSEEGQEREEGEGEGGEGGVGKNNVLTLLVQASEDEEGKYQLEDEELIGNVFLLLLAGHETTANALAGTFGFLAAHPEIQKEVYDHIVDVVGMDRDPTFEDYGRLNKVAAAFLEAVRFFRACRFWFASINRLLKAHEWWFQLVDILIREAGEDTIVDIPADPKTGKEKESIPVAKGVNVIVDMIGIRASPPPSSTLLPIVDLRDVGMV